MHDQEFHTFRDYMRKNEELTASMEDYLEMIYRLSKDTGFTRIYDLADALNVQPPSVTKMVQKLAELGFTDYEKYGVVLLSDKGKATGKVLLERHQIIETFLKLLGITEDLLNETEVIEHTISSNTLVGIVKLIKFFQERPDLIDDLSKYQDTSV
jgi:Mn-dependent DtxR family transcriptional regulator